MRFRKAGAARQRGSGSWWCRLVISMITALRPFSIEVCSGSFERRFLGRRYRCIDEKGRVVRAGRATDSALEVGL